MIATDTFTKGLRYLLQQRANKPPGVINIAGTLKAIARHHVGADQSHLDEMAKIIRRIGLRQQGLTQKNRARLRPLDDPKITGALLCLPATLMNLASREHRPQKAALLVQTAVAVEILEMTLMRMRNLIALDLEKHLQWSGRTGVLHIVIGGDETKNRDPQEFPMPPQSAEMIDTYLVKYRPLLCDRANFALFPGNGDGPKHANTLAEQTNGPSGATWGCGGIPTSSGTPEPNSISTKTLVPTVSPAESSGTVPTRRRPLIMRGKKPPPPSVTSIEQC